MADALREVAPELAGGAIELRARRVESDPVWWSSTAVVDGRFVAKFAWSRPAAARVAREIGVLAALSGPYLPEVVASSLDPVLLVTRRVPGASLFEVVDSIDRDQAGAQLAEFLAALHAAPVGGLPEARLGPQHPASTRVLRERLRPWLRDDQHGTLWSLCEWTDATLSDRRAAVLVHADLHGDNQVWSGDRLRVVVDFETAGVAEPEYDLRSLPGTGPGVELLTATVRHYRRLTGQTLSLGRILAWHLRTTLGDALWQSEAGIPLRANRRPAACLDALLTRFRELDVTPHSGRSTTGSWP
ncbi:aminoglycoside phosphotransferase family protein [Asanoa sp. NPDC050611]|uniref:aminoglycoside phosphotransferase family protein n=1 Tax=Asanoa sp. NPDC050611 TaxID=3157098 RepID=UPI0033EEFC14